MYGYGPKGKYHFFDICPNFEQISTLYNLTKKWYLLMVPCYLPTNVFFEQISSDICWILTNQMLGIRGIEW